MSTNKTKPRCCIHCGKPFPPRTRRDKQYCDDACRKAAERKELRQENGELRQRTRLTQRRAHTSPLESLRTSAFITWLIRQIARHGSIDCLGQNFDLEEIFLLYRLKGRISFKTSTACDISHLVPCKAGGAFTLDNLVILPSSVNRSQGDRVLPPPLVGRTFTKATTCKGDAGIWNQLKTRYGDQLTRFAERHKHLKGSGKTDAVNRVLDTPSSPYVYRQTLDTMEDAKFKQLCDSLNIDYNATAKESTSGDSDDPWSPSFIAHKFLHDVYTRCPKQLFTAGKQTLKLLHFSGSLLTEQECTDIYYWRFERALTSLRGRIAKQLNLTEESLMNHIEQLQIDDLFITTNIDGSKTHIMVIGDSNPDDADEAIFNSPEFQQAVRNSQETLRVTKSNLNVVDLYVSKFGGSRFTAMCKLRWKSASRRGELARYLDCHEMDIFNTKRPLPEEVTTFNRWKQSYAN